MSSQHATQNPIEAHSKLIDLQLTEAQSDLLAPLVHAATREGRNIIFMTAAPFQSDDGERVWRLQAVALPARDAYKIVTAIRKLIDGQNPSSSDSN
jgi:uncharacterized protein (DUF2384 family)